MNKKFSTLIAAFLAAGSFMSVEAGVVKVTTPVNGKSYVIAQDDAVTGGKFTAAVYALNANTDKDGVAVGAIAKEATSLTAFTKWVFGTGAAGANYYISLEADGKYLAATSATEMGIADAKEGTDIAKDNWVVSSDNLGAAFDGGTTAAATDMIKFTTAGAGDATVGLVKSTADKIFFYTESYDKTGSLLVAAPAATDFVMIKVAGKYLSYDGTNVKLVDAPAATDYAAVKAATWHYDNGTITSPMSTTATDKLTVTINAQGEVTKYAMEATATAASTTKAIAFMFDGGDYSAVKGARLSGTFSTDGVKYMEEGKFVAKVNPAKDEANEALLYSSYEVLIAPSKARLGEPGSLISSDFENGSYYMLSSDGENFLTMSKSGSTYAAATTPVGKLSIAGNSALWKVEKAIKGTDIIYTFQNKATEKFLTLSATDGTFDGTASAINGASFKSATKEGYTSGVKLEVHGKLITLATGTTPTFGQAANPGAASIIGFYNPGFAYYNALELTEKTGNKGFGVTIYNKKDGSKTIEGSTVFAGLLMPTDITKTDGVAADGAQRFQLKNDKKFIVLNKTAVWASNNDDLDGKGSYNTVRGMKFELVTEAQLNADREEEAVDQKYYSSFSVSYPIAKGQSSNEVVVEVYNNLGSRMGRLYVPAVDTKNYLTVSDFITPATESWAYVTFGDDRLAKDADLIKGQFVNIEYVNVVKTAKNYGKVAGPEGVAQEASRVQLNQPEGQFAITRMVLKKKADGTVDTYADNGNYVFTNRESQTALRDVNQLYKTDKPNVYAVAPAFADTIKITYLDKTAKFDGYKDFNSIDILNKEFNLAVYTPVMEGDAYLSENHSGKHQIGLTKELTEATPWKLVKKDAGRQTDDATATDSVYVISTVGYLSGSTYKTKQDTLAIVPFLIQNKTNQEYVIFGNVEGATYVQSYKCDENANDPANALRFALKKLPNDKYNLVQVNTEWTGKVNGEKWDVASETVVYDFEQGWFKHYYYDGDTYGQTHKMYGGFSAEKGTTNHVDMYDYTHNDIINLNEVSAPEYRKLAMNDVIKLFRNENEASVLYEKGEFLGLENAFQFEKINPALFVDTAYVDRTDNNRWEYLLTVNPDRRISDADCGVDGHPKHKADTTYGRFLVNLIDSANVFYANSVHNNKFVNEEGYAKLGFVSGYHTHDTLYINCAQHTVDTLGLDRAVTEDSHSVAKFAFRIMDKDAESFVIETKYKTYDKPHTKGTVDRDEDAVGYLKWMNGSVIVIDRIEDADVFNLKDETRNPVSNEGVQTSEVTVIAGQGVVTINNAATKKVAISNILGQVVANTVLTSDNATISVPAGIVVVTVEGEESVKAIVK